LTPHRPLPIHQNDVSSSATEASSVPQRPPQPLDLDRFFEYAVDMLCIADVKGYFRRVNHSFERVLGYTREELLARPFLEFVHEEDRLETVAQTSRLSSGQLCLAFENRYRAKDGAYKHLAWTCYPDAQSGLLYAVARDVTEERQRQSRLDGITGIPNRNVWDEVLAGEWKRSIRLRGPGASGLLDIDGFRTYNHQVGHLEGDRGLRRIAEALTTGLRRQGDLVARYDGGAFGVLFAGGLDLAAARAHCERLRQAVAALGIGYPDEHGEPRQVTISGGVAARVPDRGEAPEVLERAAQQGLQQAKARGRNRITVAT
jgi:diguanylate cyclase (GGDEF)-like protein/PAS domain S-box-containing protein